MGTYPMQKLKAIHHAILQNEMKVSVSAAQLQNAMKVSSGEKYVQGMGSKTYLLVNYK